MKTLVLNSLLSFLTILTLFGCTQTPPSDSSTSGDQPKYKAVATTGMLGDVLQQVLGEEARVKVLMGPGVDPHTYIPTRQDTLDLQNADLIFYNGFHLEGRMGEVLDLLSKDKTVLVATDFLPEGSALSTNEDTVHDPHIWMDASLFSHVTLGIAERMATVDAGNAEAYRARAKAYAEQLEALHQYGIKAVGSIPENNRTLVTAHDAFSYFGRSYGVKLLAVQGISTEAEAGLRDINALVDELVKNNVPAIFFESSVSPKTIQALLEGTQSRGHNVRIGGQLYSDAMGPAGSYEGTYLGMMDHNITIIVHALGGDVPELGFNGKLDPAISGVTLK